MTADLPTILVDTREQRPWRFDGLETCRTTLATGDYSLAGMTEPPLGVCVERKSAADLVSCITWSRARFVRALKRMAEYRTAFVVVDDANLVDILDPGRFGESTPRARLGSIIAWHRRFPSVHWFFLPDRAAAEEVVLRIFTRAARENMAAGTEVRTP